MGIGRRALRQWEQHGPCAQAEQQRQQQQAGWSGFDVSPCQAALQPQRQQSMQRAQRSHCRQGCPHALIPVLR